MPKYVPNPELIERLGPIEFTFRGKEFTIARVTQELTDRITELAKDGENLKVTDAVKAMIESAEGGTFEDVQDFDMREAIPLVQWFFKEAMAVPEKEKNAGETSEVSP
jgi:bisphosphoglycerate-dependent phosphoglycerate mutase